MVDVGFGIGGICARIAPAKFLKTHPLCHKHLFLCSRVYEITHRHTLQYYSAYVLTHSHTSCTYILHSHNYTVNTVLCYYK